MSTLPDGFITPEQYLEIERKAEFKSEYFNGEMFAMSGVTTRHDDIVAQLLVLIGQHLRGKPCRVHTADMRVLANPSGLYTYPDVTVVCGTRQFADSRMDILTNPTLLIEVLSPTTEVYDRGRKGKLYRLVPSLQELLLVAQDRFEVEGYRRSPDGSWSFFEATGLLSAFELTSIGLSLTLADIYERVVGDQS
jgi:Uma2 family endonuclease